MSIGLKSRKGWCDTNSNHHFDLGFWILDFGFQIRIPQSEFPNQFSRLAQRIKSGGLLNRRTSVQIRHRLFRFGIWDLGFGIFFNPQSQITNQTWRCRLTGLKRRSHKPKTKGSNPFTAIISTWDLRLPISDSFPTTIQIRNPQSQIPNQYGRVA